MFQFLQPIALLAIAGIIIPVIIHLWNVKQGKILKVGSISLLQQSDRQQARSLKLKDLLLLLLRCLLIVLLAMLLAKPNYKKQLTVASEKGWILAPANEVKTAYKTYKPLFDSLTNAGFQFHYFKEGFPQEKLASALAVLDNTPDSSTNYWQLLKVLNLEVPAELPVYLFTGNCLNNFVGNRPSISMNLTWKTFAATDSFSTFVTDAYRAASGNIRVALARSNPAATVLSFQDFSLQNPAANFALKRNNGVSVSYRDSLGNSSTTAVDTATLNIVIFADNYLNDANYLKAAINAIREFGQYRIKLTVVKNVSEIPAKHDWLFWLSEQPVPAAHLSENVFVYEKGKQQANRSWITFNNENGAAGEPIELTQYIQNNTAATSNLQTLWADGYGNPLLSVNGETNKVYHFFSHFNPSWSGLVWSREFPALLHRLLFNNYQTSVYPLDKRMIDANQFQPGLSNSSRTGEEKFVETIDLANLFWLLAFIVFCMERFFSLSVKKEVANG